MSSFLVQAAFAPYSVMDVVSCLIALGAFGVAIWAAYSSAQTRRAQERANTVSEGQNRSMFEANAIAREAKTIADSANDFAREANEIAKQALAVQEEQGKLRLKVTPQMRCVYSDAPEDIQNGKIPRPVVEVTNLSAFPVTITRICFPTDNPPNSIIWLRPQLNAPYHSLPARLPPRSTLIALGKAGMLKASDLAKVVGCEAYTECGEIVRGITEEFQNAIDEAKKSAGSSDS